MTRPSFLLAFLSLAVGPACAPADKQDGAADLAAFSHERLADGVKHPTFVDFGSKLTLVGYDVSPEDAAHPGEAVRLTLYWRRTGRLDSGWAFFTHLEDELGRQISNFDREGAFRGAVNGKQEGLAALELGKVYTDEQTLTVPKSDALTPKITIVVGVWNDQMRLPIISGPTNGHDAAIVAHLATGVPRRSAATVRQGTSK
jgi:hypothetical protein